MIGIVKEEELLYISKTPFFYVPFLINFLFAKTCQNRPWKLYAWKSTLFELPISYFAWYRPPNAYVDIFHQLEESMKVLDRENKEIIQLWDISGDILPNYLDGDSLSNSRLIHSRRILEFYNLFGFLQLIIFNPACSYCHNQQVKCSNIWGV